MATVPGEPAVPDNVVDLVPKHLQPTQGDFLMAAAIMHQQGKFGAGGEYQVAGDVVPFARKPLNLTSDPQQLDDYKKMMTRDTLSRALGGTSNVLPIKPEDK